MATMRILTHGEPQLKDRARDVDCTSEDLSGLIADMVDTMREAHGVGLAATQLGVMKRVFVYEVDEEPPRAILNPEIVATCKDTEEEEEGCLSVPDVKVSIKRSCHVTVRGTDERGESVEVEADGLLARVVQHEIDHLDGVLILDRASRAERKRAIRQQKEAARERAGLPPLERAADEVPGL